MKKTIFAFNELNYNFECDWFVELSDNKPCMTDNKPCMTDNKLSDDKLSDNNLTSELGGIRSLLNQSKLRKF